MPVRTYHRTVLVIEVLSNEPYSGGIDNLSDATGEGGNSASVLSETTSQVDAVRCRRC